MDTSKKVFLIGPGYIGWNVLELLVAEGYIVSGMVRRKEHAQGIERSGAAAVYGDLDDHNLIVKNVLKNDVSHRPSLIPSVAPAQALELEDKNDC